MAIENAAISSVNGAGSLAAFMLPSVHDENPLDLVRLWSTDLAPIPAYQGGILRPGQQASLTGGGKVGKSLFALEMALSLAAGLPFLGDQPKHGMVRVLYIDKENGVDDLHGRLHAIGIEPHPNLVYLSFPETLTAFDDKQGADWLRHQIGKYRPNLVIIDTASRFVQGPENESTTWLAFYRISLSVLKGQGIASLRLDHFGKDTEKGARGSSAKSQDIDEGWVMQEAPPLEGPVDPTLFEFKREVSRSGLGRDRMVVKRTGQKVTLPDGTELWARGETRHNRTSSLVPPRSMSEPWKDPVQIAQAILTKWPEQLPTSKQLREPAALASLRGLAGWTQNPNRDLALRVLTKLNENRSTGRLTLADMAGVR